MMCRDASWSCAPRFGDVTHWLPCRTRPRRAGRHPAGYPAAPLVRRQHSRGVVSELRCVGGMLWCFWWRRRGAHGGHAVSWRLHVSREVSGRYAAVSRERFMTLACANAPV
eukprot:1661252-Prymnesium_polylepis.2